MPAKQPALTVTGLTQQGISRIVRRRDGRGCAAARRARGQSRKRLQRETLIAPLVVVSLSLASKMRWASR